MGRRLWHPGLYLALAVVLALGLAPGVTGGQGLRESMFTILMSVGLASSLNILVGYTGYVSFGHIVFFGLGGYVGFYTMTQLGWPLPLAALVGGVTAGILAFILGRILLRLRGAYFALATLGILEAMRAFVTNFSPFGGSIGLSLNFSAYRAYGGANEALWLTYWILVGLVGSPVRPVGGEVQREANGAAEGGEVSDERPHGFQDAQGGQGEVGSAQPQKDAPQDEGEYAG